MGNRRKLQAAIEHVHEVREADRAPERLSFHVASRDARLDADGPALLHPRVRQRSRRCVRPAEAAELAAASIFKIKYLL